MTVLAIDIGGTKFAAALVGTDGALRARTELPVGPSPTDTLHRLVSGSGHARDLSGIGIGAAGPIDVLRGEVSPINIPGWRGFPVVDAVKQVLPGLPVTLAGDAQCMALGEWWRGGRAEHSLLGIVVSTGIGGGLILDGHLYLGSAGNAGHIGHVIIDRDGEPCPCGGTGCLETIASGPSMVRWALAQGWVPTEAVDARTLAVDASKGADIPRAAFRRAGKALGVAIVSTAALLDVHHVVIGGGVSAVGDLLLRPIREAAAVWGGSQTLHTVTITATSLHRDAGLYGAAALALTEGGQSLLRPGPA
jgi:predicted NBD/HSP70 family sugar kinase